MTAGYLVAGPSHWRDEAILINNSPQFPTLAVYHNPMKSASSCNKYDIFKRALSY